MKNPNSRRAIAAAVLAIALADALFYLFAPDVLPGQAHLAAKCVPALCLAVWAALGASPPFAGLIAAGLVLSALGDGLLSYSSGTFLAGMVAFLSAHVCYLAAFTRRTRSLAPLAAAPFLAWGIAAYLLVLPQLGGMATPVAAYVAVICAMMWRAGALALDRSVPARVRSLALTGAVLFGLSDTLIAFGKWGGPIHPGGIWVMLLYWLGQLGIAASGAWMPATE